ncbi:MAG: DEAD/DEAH box helicase [Clostridium sp.]|uniref:DEAD/DEAH box helicase n=1 Tax=Clostridium sp. TaxID=1506 RepID=UPI00304B658A
MIFENLDIIKPIQKALKDEGYKTPTPIQEKAIPSILEGKDLLGCAQTGTGKTAAFAVPVLQNIYNDKDNNKATKGTRKISALVLAPTRELAIQIGESFTSYSCYMNMRNTVIFGGVSQGSQAKALHDGIDVLVATPGRLLDLINQKLVDLSHVKYFVLDEADRMLDMGMINDVKKIIARMPSERQNMLFSATMPREISNLVNSILRNPVKIEVTPVSSTTETITQGVYFVDKKNKKDLLIELLKDDTITSVLVFSRTKHGADKITGNLVNAGVEAKAIHGNKSQNARQLALKNFKDGKIRVLVATDIAARGIDVDELSYVINYDFPDIPETYVHRIGRTGRAGYSGTAYSFCDIEERSNLKDIEKLIGKKIPTMEENPYPAVIFTIPEKTKSNTGRGRNSGRSSNGNTQGEGKSGLPKKINQNGTEVKKSNKSWGYGSGAGKGKSQRSSQGRPKSK